MKVVIIGGVAGGASAATRLRRLDEKAEIIILEKSGYVSYANCGLPYYVGGVIADAKKLTLQTPESLWNRFRIDVRVHNEATAIDPKGKTVTVKRLKDGSTYAESYDKLILSPGARPLKPPLDGIEDERIFTLRTVEDTHRMRSFVEKEKPKSAVVVGGGFIGLEMAENLVELGVKTTLVERLNQVMMPLDYDMACDLHAQLKRHGLALRLETAVTGFSRQGSAVLTHIENSDAISADFVVLAIGVAPDTAIARESGLALGPRGAIIVNEHMQTSGADIYAVGDAVEVWQRITGTPTMLPLAGPANKQGRIAAGHICGLGSKFTGVQGTSVLKVFDMTVATTGLNEKMATAEGIRAQSVISLPASHATYYPGATTMTFKALFDPEDGRILGAQIVGRDGVDKRIDVLATAIRAGMTAYDLAELELAYAPPYGSAKDPVNMVGFIMENILAGRLRQFTWRDVETLRQDEDVILLDVRTQGEYAHAHIDGALSMPLDTLRENLSQLDKAKPVYVYCHSGMRSYNACRILSQHGFDCFNLSGGFQFYQAVVCDKAEDPAVVRPCEQSAEKA